MDNNTIRAALQLIEESPTQNNFRKLFVALYTMGLLRHIFKMDARIRLRRFDDHMQPFSEIEKTELLNQARSTLTNRVFDVGVRVSAFTSEGFVRYGRVIGVDYEDRRVNIRWENGSNRSWRKFKDVQIVN